MTKDSSRPDPEFYDPGPKGSSGFGWSIVMGLAILAALLLGLAFFGVSMTPTTVTIGLPRVATPAPTPPPTPAAPVAPASPDGPPASP